MPRISAKHKALAERAEKWGLYLTSHNPGDFRRYRFRTEADSSYYGDGCGVYTALSLKDATIFLDGWVEHALRFSRGRKC
jgi:hypothetical protein